MSEHAHRVFDANTQSLGKRIVTIARDTGTPYTAFVREAKDMIEDVRGLLDGGEDWQCYYEFIANDDLNAVAFEGEGMSFIGTYDGAVRWLSVMFMRMMADPRIASEIGDAAAETSNLPTVPRILSETKRAGGGAPATALYVRPRDPRRHQYAVFLSVTAMQFLIAHEIGHLVLGHCGFVTDNGGIPFLFERMNAGPRSNLDMQALEWDADRFASRMVISGAVGSLERPDLIPEAAREMFSSPAAVVRGFARAISGLVQLLAVEWDWTTLNHLSHPPPILRMNAIGIAMLEMLKAAKGADFQAVAEDFIYSAVETDLLLAQLLERKADPDRHEVLLDPRAERHFIDLDTRAKSMRPNLVKHARMRHDFFDIFIATRRADVPPPSQPGPPPSRPGGST